MPSIVQIILQAEDRTGGAFASARANLAAFTAAARQAPRLDLTGIRTGLTDLERATRSARPFDALTRESAEAVAAVERDFQRLTSKRDQLRATIADVGLSARERRQFFDNQGRTRSNTADDQRFDTAFENARRATSLARSEGDPNSIRAELEKAEAAAQQLRAVMGQIRSLRQSGGGSRRNAIAVEYLEATQAVEQYGRALEAAQRQQRAAQSRTQTLERRVTNLGAVAADPRRPEEQRSRADVLATATAEQLKDAYTAEARASDVAAAAEREHATALRQLTQAQESYQRSVRASGARQQTFVTPERTPAIRQDDSAQQAAAAYASLDQAVSQYIAQAQRATQVDAEQAASLNVLTQALSRTAEAERALVTAQRGQARRVPRTDPAQPDAGAQPEGRQGVPRQTATAYDALTASVSQYVAQTQRATASDQERRASLGALTDALTRAAAAQRAVSAVPVRQTQRTQEQPAQARTRAPSEEGIRRTATAYTTLDQAVGQYVTQAERAIQTDQQRRAGLAALTDALAQAAQAQRQMLPQQRRVAQPVAPQAPQTPPPLPGGPAQLPAQRNVAPNVTGSVAIQGTDVARAGLAQVGTAATIAQQQVTGLGTASTTTGRQTATLGTAASSASSRVQGLTDTLVLQRQRLDTLGQALDETRQKHAANSLQVRRAEDAYDRQTIAIRRTERALRDANQAAAARPAGGLGPALPRTVEQFGRGALGQIGVGLGVEEVGQQLIALGQESTGLAVKAETIGRAYQQATAQAGIGAQDLMRSLQAASRGTVTEARLQLNANRALALGVSTSIEDMSALLAIARQRGKDFGISTEEAFDRIVLGIGKAEPEILDELGILLDSNRVYKEYAASIGISASALDKKQKVQAITNQLLRDNAALIATNAAAELDSADKINQAAARFQDAKTRLGTNLLPGATRAVSAGAGAVDLMTGNLGLRDLFAGLTPGQGRDERVGNLASSIGRLTNVTTFFPEMQRVIAAAGESRATGVVPAMSATDRETMDAERRAIFNPLLIPGLFAEQSQSVPQASVATPQTPVVQTAVVAPMQPQSAMVAPPQGTTVNNYYTVNQTVQGSVAAERDLTAAVRRGLQQTSRQNGINPVMP